MLNLAKASSGHREVFVAQPDNVTEKMAGKVFIVFELETKKSDAKKILDFLINGIDEFYYQDEKIFLRDKIPGLELENIFEAFLTKLNRALTEFLIEEKIRVKSSDFNITLGLVYENQLIFSNLGRNKAYLIYRKKDQYEIINVEASASDVELSDLDESDNEESINEKIKNFKIFSSVINGEIPIGSYFFFTNENLPEYLSTKEMVLIITKLPPMVATEQMKQSLSKVNSFAPFLGIIIKNTLGLSEQDQKDEILENLSAQSSISTLNHTEKKTEGMLSPTGIIDSRDFKNNFNDFFSKIYYFLSSLFKKKDKKVKEAVQKTMKQTSFEKPKSRINIKTRIEVVRSSSIISKFINSFKNFIISIFSISFWTGFFASLGKNLRTLHPKRKLLLALGFVLLIVFLLSISHTIKQRRLQEHNENFISSIESIENRYVLIESYLLYNNEAGAKIIIGEINEEISSLEALNEEQEEILYIWNDKIKNKRQEIQRLIVIEEFDQILDTKNLNQTAEPRNLALIDNYLYITDPKGKIIYIYKTYDNEVTSNLINASGDLSLKLPFVYDNQIYYLANDSLAQINPELGSYKETSIAGLANKKTDALDIYEVNNLLYSLHSSENSILRHSPANSFNQSNQWLQEDVDLSSAIDMAVTGEIWVLKSNSEIIRLWSGLIDSEFTLASIDPPLNNANKLIVSENNLYIFDRKNSRLASYKQSDGSLILQYQFSGLKNIFDIIIDHDLEKVYLLSDTKVYSFSL